MASRRYTKRQVLAMLDDSDEHSSSEAENEDSEPESDDKNSDNQTEDDSPVDGSDDKSGDSSSVPSWSNVTENDQPHTLPNFVQTLVFKSMLQISKLHTSSKFFWTTIS